MSKLIESAEKRVVLIDNYIDESVLVLLSKRKANVSAVATSTHAESYKLGIILDGSHYYNLNTTSDREIVKPAVFNMLGWNLMRVFTLDWFLYPENVKKKIVEKLN